MTQAKPNDSLHLESHFRISGKPIVREVGEETFIMSEDSEMHWLQNESASLLWHAIAKKGQEGTSLRELVALFLEHYEVAEEVAEGDIRAFLRHFLGLGLLARVSSTKEGPK